MKHFLLFPFCLLLFPFLFLFLFLFPLLFLFCPWSQGSDGILRTSRYSDLVGDVGRERHVTNGHVVHDVDASMDCSDAESALWERQVIYCTPVPGLQPWASGAPQDSHYGAPQAAGTLSSMPGGHHQGVTSAETGGDVSMEEDGGSDGVAGAGQRRGFAGGGEPEAKRRCVDTSKGRPIDVVVKVGVW